MTAVRIVEFTDPTCPFGYNADPIRHKLMWLYGDAIEWQLRMVGLSESVEEIEAKGLTVELIGQTASAFAERYGMPAGGAAPARLSASMPACRAIVAARESAPGSEYVLARWLRILYFADLRQLDEEQTLLDAAREAGLDLEAFAGWLAAPETESALRDDLAAARSPAPAAHALDHKLAGPPGERRYTCPSYEVSAGDDLIVIPGFWSAEPYEVALANLAPDVEQRPFAESAEEVLRWASEPLATVEVATIRDISREDARAELTEVGVERAAGGGDGFWTLG